MPTERSCVLFSNSNSASGDYLAVVALLHLKLLTHQYQEKQTHRHPHVGLYNGLPITPTAASRRDADQIKPYLTPPTPHLVIWFID